MTQLAHSTDPFATSLSGRRLGRYEVLARLASGGMAAVYVARALGVAGFERLFAIKVLHPHLAHEDEFITMFLDEARLAARIRHPNVVPTTDISDTRDAGFYLVMDYIEGDHLGALLQHAFKRGDRLPTAVTLRIVVDALEGLGAAHQLTNEHGEPLNLVHRDVSPHNIMVSTDGVARITDFGVAKASIRLSATGEGQFKGKLAYMAPEHATNGQSDQRSDLFAMAIILWESLTGRRLFRAENHAATLNKICLEPIPVPSEVDPSLAVFDPILARGLSRDPNQRFQTAEEFAVAIERVAEELGGMANQRTVGKLVRDLAADKIARDQGLIRSAVAQLSARTSVRAPVGRAYAAPTTDARQAQAENADPSASVTTPARRASPGPPAQQQATPAAAEAAGPPSGEYLAGARPTAGEPNSGPLAHAFAGQAAPPAAGPAESTPRSQETPPDAPQGSDAAFAKERVQLARAAADAAAARVAALNELEELEQLQEASRRRGGGLWVGSALVALAIGATVMAALWVDRPGSTQGGTATDQSHATDVMDAPAPGSPAPGADAPTGAAPPETTEPEGPTETAASVSPAVTDDQRADEPSAEGSEEDPSGEPDGVPSDGRDRTAAEAAQDADREADTDREAAAEREAKASRDGRRSQDRRDRASRQSAPRQRPSPPPPLPTPAPSRTDAPKQPTLRVRPQPETKPAEAPPSLAGEDDLLLNPYR